MSDQNPSDKILHQDAVESVIDERLADALGVVESVIDQRLEDASSQGAIATPASPGASYVQAEVVALRTAIAAILVVLRDAGLIPT